MNLAYWFLLLIVQNAAFTLVSRARNSGSYSYHAVAAVFSNGVWFASQFLLIGMVAKPGMGLAEASKLGAVYVTATVIGSVLMHWISVTYLERGKRKVGA
jgi:hypothetical protein